MPKSSLKRKKKEDNEEEEEKEEEKEERKQLRGKEGGSNPKEKGFLSGTSRREVTLGSFCGDLENTGFTLFITLAAPLPE